MASSDRPRRPRRLRAGVVLALAAAGLSARAAAPLRAQAPPDESPHSRASLVSEVTAVAPGRPFTVSLRIELEPGWHTYWKNPGDSGTEALLAWELPEGWSAGRIQWPRPHRIAYPPLMSYGYEGEVLLLVDVEPPPVLEAEVRLRAAADWLVCQEICLPAHAELSLSLPSSSGPAQSDPRWAARIRAARLELPLDDSGWSFRATPTADGYDLAVTPPAGSERTPADLYFYPLDPTLVYHAPAQPEHVADGVVHLGLVRSPYNTDPPTLEGVLVTEDEPGFDGRGVRHALSVSAPVMAVGEAGPPGVAARPGDAAGRRTAPATPAWTVALGFAFLGGLLLNLMPCVFPVLSLKIVGFVERGAGDPRVAFRHGMAFALGVVLSFLGLAAALLAVRAAGTSVGWGFQLQNPVIVAILAMLIFSVGLNFLGVYEVGGALTRLAGADAARWGYVGSLLTGVLATAVATPCTAPFMGAAVGAALVRPAVEGLAIFAVLGAGMATPYTVLSAWPGLLRRLPRPGRWMETLRQVMAFPMFAVTIWLVWVFGLQTAVAGAAWLLTGLLCVSFAAWLLGRWPAPSLRRRTRWATRTAAAGVLALAAAAVLRGANVRPGPSPVSTAPAVGVWEPYSPARLASLRGLGRRVFVDFTAAWCISCQVNERVVLSRADVLDAFARGNVALLRADWTRRDEVITRALAAFGRSGVPLYVLYEPGAEAPRILPAVLSPGVLYEALRGDPSRPSSTASDSPAGATSKEDEHEQDS